MRSWRLRFSAVEAVLKTLTAMAWLEWGRSEEEKGGNEKERGLCFHTRLASDEYEDSRVINLDRRPESG